MEVTKEPHLPIRQRYNHLSQEFELGASLRILHWRDPILDSHGFGVDSEYAELFWLPTLGPSVLWLLRRVATFLISNNDSVAIESELLGAMLGLKFGKARDSLIEKTIRRCIYFSVARPTGSDSIAFKTSLGPLSQRQLERLPEPLRALHERHAPVDLSTRLIREELQARKIAMTLAQMGVSNDEIPSALERLNFEGDLASRVASALP